MLGGGTGMKKFEGIAAERPALSARARVRSRKARDLGRPLTYAFAAFKVQGSFPFAPLRVRMTTFFISG